MGSTLSWIQEPPPPPSDRQTYHPRLIYYKKPFFHRIRSSVHDGWDLVEFIRRHEDHLSRKVILKGLFKAINFDNMGAFYIILSFYRHLLTELNEQKLLLLFAKKDILFKAPTSMLNSVVLNSNKTFFNKLMENSQPKSLSYFISYVLNHKSNM